MQRSFQILGAAAVALLSAVPGFAQPLSDIDTVRRQQNRIIERETQLRRAERNRLLRSNVPPSHSSADLLPSIARTPGACIQIDRIAFQGVENVPVPQLEAQVENLKGLCLTAADIQNILRAVTNFYIEQGFVTSRAYLVPQDLGEGELQVLVVEGEVEKVRLLENGVERKGQTQLFGARGGRIMNMRDFEQGLEQINRLGSKQATIRIEPGTGVGQSIVKVEVDDAYAVEVSSAINNDGSTSTGRHQWMGSARFEDVFGAHEQLVVSARSSLDKLNDRIYSRSINAYFSIPWQYWTLNASGSYLEYLSRFESASGEYSYNGENWEGRIGLDRVLHRTGAYIWRGGAAFTVKEATNYIEDVFIDASSQRLTVLEAHSGISGRIAGGFAQANVAVRRGLDVFAAQSDGSASHGTPSAQFTQVSLDGFYQRVWRTPLGQFSAQASVYASYSPDTLFASERVSIGGPASVHGFRDVSLSGDAGGYGQLELGWTPSFAHKLPERVTQVVGLPQVFAGLDAGAIAQDSSDPLEGGELLGGVFGLRTGGGLLSGEVAYETALAHPSSLDLADSGFFRFRVSVSHSF